MNWIIEINNFMKKDFSSFFQFFYRTLEFNKKDSTNKWNSLYYNLKKWNKEYLNQYENISLCSPVMWNLNISISNFNISEDIDESWLYWACLSSYINYCVSNELILRKNENIINPQSYLLKTKENIGVEAEEFLSNTYWKELIEKKYIWINKKVFLQELAQKNKILLEDCRKNIWQRTLICINPMKNTKRYFTL